MRIKQYEKLINIIMQRNRVSSTWSTEGVQFVAQFKIRVYLSAAVTSLSSRRRSTMHHVTVTCDLVTPTSPTEVKVNRRVKCLGDSSFLSNHPHTCRHTNTHPTDRSAWATRVVFNKFV